MFNLFDPAYHLPPVGCSDYQCIFLKPKSKLNVPPTTKRVRLMKPGNWIALSMKAFNDIVMYMLDKTMPKRTVRFHPSDKPWITCYIKTQIKARQRAFSRRDKTNYERLCQKVSTLVFKAKVAYYQNKAKDYRKSNPEKWFKSIASLASINDSSTSLASLSNNELSDLAEKLQAAFTKSWKNLGTENASRLQVNDAQHLPKETTPPLSSIGQVKMVLKQLKTKKVTGIDGIPAWFLKQYYEDLAPAVHNIIISSISQCKYLTIYKHALITPITKVNPPTKIEKPFRTLS